MRDRDLSPCAVVAISPKRAEVDGDPFVRSADIHPHVKEGRGQATLGLFNPEYEAECVVVYDCRRPRKHTSSELCRALQMFSDDAFIVITAVPMYRRIFHGQYIVTNNISSG
jgi:hypothetical protein